jgi:hypothetical protein
MRGFRPAGRRRTRTDHLAALAIAPALLDGHGIDRDHGGKRELRQVGKARHGLPIGQGDGRREAADCGAEKPAGVRLSPPASTIPNTTAPKINPQVRTVRLRGCDIRFDFSQDIDCIR